MTTSNDEIQKQIDDIKERLENSRRRLQILQVREAKEGSSVSPEVKIEIEDLEKKTIPNLRSELQRLEQMGMEAVSHVARLSDRLVSDNLLNRTFILLKENCSEIATTIKFLPGLAKDWFKFSEAIDGLANSLIPRDWGAEDIFILCCAIYLHKMGLVPANRAQDSGNVFDRYPLLTRDYILSRGNDFGLDPGQKEDVAWVCYGHRNLVNEDKSIENTLADSELLLQTRRGYRTRAEIAYYLKILSLLGAFDVRLSAIIARTLFTGPSSDYLEYRMNSVVAGFDIRPPSENTDRLIILRARLSEDSLVEDIRFLQKARENLENAIKDCPSHIQDNIFSNTIVELDYSVFAKELEVKVPTKQFANILQEATRKSIVALLENRYGESDPYLKGWGPVFFHPRGATPNSHNTPKESQEARVANTAEVFLAFAGWLECAVHDEKVVNRVIEAINTALPTLKNVQVKNIEMRSADEVKRSESTPDKFNPLASLTFVVPTTRANSLFILSAAHLLREMKKYHGLNQCKNDVHQIMKECIDWLCNTETGPFNEKIIRFLPTEYLFQSILAFRAMINSREYWTNLQTGFNYELVDSNIAKFVHSLHHKHGSEKGWPATAFKAMALEILLYYREQTNERIFNQKPMVERLRRSFVQEILDEAKLDSSLPWKDDNQILIDEDRKHARPWTHVTSVWAIEGLTRCMAAGLLSPEQKGKLLQTIPIILLKQNQDGFYDSIPHPDDPESTTIHSIFKTALYTYAMTQIQKILPSS